MIELFSLEMVLAVIFAAVVAMIVRLADYPSNLFDKAELIKMAQAFIASLLASFFVGWMMIEQGLDLMVFQNFLLLAIGALGGMATVRALFETAEAIRPGK